MFSTHEYKITILEKNLDTFGHVNNATYLELLEEARWDWITQGGFGLKEILSGQMGPTILEIKIRFKREIKNRQKITIKSHVVRYEGKIGEVEQHMINEQNEVCCTANFVIGLFDTQKRKLIDPTPEWLAAVGKISK